MRIKYFLLLIIFTVALCPAWADTFVVTKNLDSGPGTLREALTLAAQNGATDQDIIKFNLPGTLVSDRIIRLKTQLPCITSNVVIDGTSQPGTPFGVSDARVIIEPEQSPVGFSGLVISGDYYNGTQTQSTEKIEIYGLYIRNFAKITSFSYYDQSQGSGIYFINGANNVTIGAPGKGNVLSGNMQGIGGGYNYSYYAINSITIQSNLIGVNEDGTTLNSNIYGINLYIDQSLTIGGDNVNKGNVVAGNITNIAVSRSYYYTNYNSQATILIQNNKIGTDYTGTKDFKQHPLFTGTAFLTTYGIQISTSTSNTKADILDNVISGQKYYGIYLDYVSFNIKGNKIGTDITGTHDLGNAEAIRINNNASGVIGGTNAADKNYIGYNNYGIEVQSSPQVQITQNSIFCNTQYGISVPSYYPFVKVLKYTGTGVAGIATPNSSVELFYVDDCPGICQGKEYITTVQVDGSGKWVYNGTISKVVVATATNTSNKTTSAFSSLTIDDSEVTKKHLTCAYTGSITISPDREGILFHWDKKEDNGTLTPVADVQNISNLQPGTYVLTVQYPGGCQKFSQQYIINDDRLVFKKVIMPDPQCRQKVFQFSLEYERGTNPVFEWVNEQNVVVATGVNVTMPAGKYTLRISDGGGCSQSIPLDRVTAKIGPEFDYSAVNIKPAMCGQKDGYIKGLIAFPNTITGNASYQWYQTTYNNNQFVDVLVPGATNPDLVDVDGGTYYLVVTDEGECGSPWKSIPQYVDITKSVFLSDAYTTPVNCGNDGSITGIQVTNADKYEWTGPNNQPIANNNGLNLYGLTEGTYTLKATNTITGCFNSRYYTIGRNYATNFNFSRNVTDARCGEDNAAAALTFNGTEQPTSIVWKDETGSIVGYGKSISDRKGNTKYEVWVTDYRNCAAVKLTDVSIGLIPKLELAADNNIIATDDQCDLNTGNVQGVSVTGGLPPYRYTWKNSSGKVVGTDSKLIGVGADSYTLTIQDGTDCGIINAGTYTVNNKTIPIVKPDVKDVKICSPETVNFLVENSQTGTYCLYKNATDLYPLTTSDNERISYKITETGDYYIGLKVGSCESPRAKVHVEVILIDIEMGNTFSPNNDGINDYWKIQGIHKFPGSVVQVFDRYGHLVYQSKNYNVPFNGTYNGKNLPADVYYYIIDLKTTCKILSGNLTIVR